MVETNKNFLEEIRKEVEREVDIGPLFEEFNDEELDKITKNIVKNIKNNIGYIEHCFKDVTKDILKEVSEDNDNLQDIEQEYLELILHWFIYFIVDRKSLEVEELMIEHCQFFPGFPQHEYSCVQIPLYYTGELLRKLQ